MLFVGRSDLHFDELSHFCIDLLFSLRQPLQILSLLHRPYTVKPGRSAIFRRVERKEDRVVTLINAVWIGKLLGAETDIVFL